MKFRNLIAVFVVVNLLLTTLAVEEEISTLSEGNNDEVPHKINLDENQKGEGKSNLVFSQDEKSFYYILVTKPLKGVDVSQFVVTVNSTEIDVKLVVSSKKKK